MHAWGFVQIDFSSRELKRQEVVRDSDSLGLILGLQCRLGSLEVQTKTSPLERYIEFSIDRFVES